MARSGTISSTIRCRYSPTPHLRLGTFAMADAPGRPWRILMLPRPCDRCIFFLRMLHCAILRFTEQLCRVLSSHVLRARQMSAFALQSLGLIGISQMAPKLQMPFQILTSSDAPAAEASSTAPPPSSSTTSSSTTAAAAAPTPSGVRFKAQCPIDFAAGRTADSNATDAEPARGLDRVTRHPQLWSLALLGCGAAVASPFVTERLLFGAGPLAMASLGAAHQDSRYRRGSGGQLTPERDAATSLVPFGAAFGHNIGSLSSHCAHFFLSDCIRMHRKLRDSPFPIQFSSFFIPSLNLLSVPVALLTGVQSWGALWSETKGLNALVAIAAAGVLALRRGRRAKLGL